MKTTAGGDESRLDGDRDRLLVQAAAERERFRDVILHAPAPIALHVGPEHRYELVNDAYRRISGGGRDVTGMAVREAFPELEGQGLFEAIDKVYATGEPFIVPELLVRYDRTGAGIEDAWINLRLEPLRDVDGHVSAILNFSFDLTEQVRARLDAEAANEQLSTQAVELELSNQQLQENAVELEAQTEELLATTARLEERTQDAELARARTDAILSSIADPFILLDADWFITLVNEPALPILQTTRERLLGRTLWDAFPGLEGSIFEPHYRDAMRSGLSSSVENYFAPLDTWFDVRIYPWPGGLMVHFRDVTARKTADAERERLLAEATVARAEAEAARRIAEEASRAKGEFLAVMSHELRTPLNAIGGYADLIAMGIRGPVTAAQLADLERIQQSQRHLTGVIDEVLNFAKLETGTVRYELADVPVREALAGAETLVAPQARTKGLTLDVDRCSPALVVRADPERLRQVLVNLLSNAIKFTSAAGTVTLRCEGDGDRIRMTVRDTGIGIALDQRGRIFEPFTQVRSDLTRPHEGTGLGLAISSDLARGMGGELTVESEMGVGSTFTLTLPQA